MGEVSLTSLVASLELVQLDTRTDTLSFCPGIFSLPDPRACLGSVCSPSKSLSIQFSAAHTLVWTACLIYLTPASLRKMFMGIIGMRALFRVVETCCAF